MKKTKNLEFAHTPRSPEGMGDFYGTAIRQPLGRIRGDSMGMVQVTPKKLKTPPKTLA